MIFKDLFTKSAREVNDFFDTNNNNVIQLPNKKY